MAQLPPGLRNDFPSRLVDGPVVGRDRAVANSRQIAPLVIQIDEVLLNRAPTLHWFGQMAVRSSRANDRPGLGWTSQFTQQPPAHPFPGVSLCPAFRGCMETADLGPHG
jgi:hypothetical protein